MRIGLVLRHFNPERGGAERWTCDLADRALAAGYEVHGIAQKFAPPGRGPAVIPHLVSAVRSPYAFATALDEKLRKLNLDVVHDMGFGWNFDILQPHMGAWRAQFERKLLAMPRWKRVVRRALSTATPRTHERDRVCWRQYADQRRLVIALSKLVARDLERSHGWPMERSRLIYNGVDLKRFTPESRHDFREPLREELKLREDEIVVLFVAHNFALKGLSTLIESVGQLRREGKPVKLLVLGSDRPGSYKRDAQQAGAGEAVQFLGAVGNTLPYYAAADVFALPTWYDSCSLVVLEALACGLPVITTSHNGAAELLTDGFDGFVLDNPGDSTLLAQRLRSLLDPAVRSRVGAAARRLAERHPIEANFRQVMGVWEQVAGRMRRAA